MTDEIVTAEEQAVRMLAKLDARQTPEPKLLAIFQTSAEGLAEARRAEGYQTAYAEELGDIEMRNAIMDDSWDAIEAKTLGDLREAVELGAVADPQMMLRIAATSNKMGRRAASRTADANSRKSAAANPAIDASPTTVIRLRTRMVKRLNSEDGHQRLLERETEVVTSTSHKLDETMPADEMHRHIKQSLGAKVNENVRQGSSGPDTVLDIEIDDIDFDDPMIYRGGR